MAGAPKGNTNSATGKDGRRALEMALENHGNEEPLEVVGKIATLIKMWQPIIENAMTDGDLAAMKEINDRLDVKANQSIDIQADIVATEKKLTKREIELLAKELENNC